MTEPEWHDERRHTPWAQPGWRAWNQHSPEVEVCSFLEDVCQITKPLMIVETGCGQGFVCRRLPVHTLHYEADPEWRRQREEDGIRCQPEPSPTFRALRQADLLILDSDSPWREREIVWWWQHGKAGSLCFVHDTGNGHGEHVYHTLLGNLVRATGLSGWWFPNPRGSWLGVHP